MLIIGLIVCCGYLFGSLGARLGLPRVTGYILAGIALNPAISHIIPETFVQHTDLLVNLMLCFITFSVGGTLSLKKLRKEGKTILYLTFFEAEGAFLLVSGGFFFLLLILGRHFGIQGVLPSLALAVLLGSLASPTDPSATLAVAHEYNAKGPIISTIMGVAAFDDALGIINYSVAVALAASVLTDGPALSAWEVIASPLWTILLSLGLGAAFGLLLDLISRPCMKKGSYGQITVLMLGTLALCFGTSTRFAADELLATMTMGAIVVNRSPWQEKIFDIVGSYLEELVFVLFFVVSCMHLDLAGLKAGLLFIPFFIALRAAGKILGIRLGCRLAGAPEALSKYVPGGLIPQGGIVVGLALLMRQHHLLGDMGPIILGIIIGATIVHELIGPLLARRTLTRAGEIQG
jgi:Kef-type K+ transport system membrane component KefB